MESKRDSEGGGGGAGLKVGFAVVAVVVIIAAVVLVTRSGDSEPDAAEGDTTDTTAPTETTGGGGDEAGGNSLGADHWGAGYDGSLPPARDAFGPDDDPLDAPDCDAERGRLAIPSFYAPNCVPLWPEGRDNGGATHRGVTADEIVVAIYAAEGDPILTAQVEGVIGESTTTAEETAANRALVLEAHNALYETYGRTVRVETLEASGGANDEAAARADALRAANEIGAFVVLGGPTTAAFADTLAAEGVICFCAASQPIEYYLDRAPYVWGDLMASSQLYIHRVQYIGERLIGRPAVHAGDPAMHDQERRMAIVYFETAEGIYGQGVDFFEEQLLELYDYELADRIAYTLDSARIQEDATTIVGRLKDRRITSVIFAGDAIFPLTLTAEATNQEYYPEWILTGSSLTTANAIARGYDPDQWPNAFGITSLTIGVDEEVTQQEANMVSWYLGEELTSYPSIIPLGRLFAGIHLAGPNLTPETFRDGLFSLKPVSGAITRFGVSYGRGLWPWDDYTASDDVAEVWWDPDSVSSTGSVGNYRYTNGGARVLPGEWDGELEVFNPDTAVNYLNERPESDLAPRYPRRSGRAG
jgi:hypothetical protein